VRIDGPRAAQTSFVMDWKLTDENRVIRLTLSTGALTHRTDTSDAPLTGPADLTLTFAKPALVAILTGSEPTGVELEGDPALLGTFMALLDEPDSAFPIVTPRTPRPGEAGTAATTAA